jgi:2,4-dienoyl-CoA reductase-like NADH-dependent reductase (Old Yellow Enzyme family)
MAADDGAYTPKLIDLTAALAKGGLGLIISSHAYVAPEGQTGPWQLGVYKDALVPSLEAMAKAVPDNDRNKYCDSLRGVGSARHELCEPEANKLHKFRYIKLCFTFN